MPRLLLVDDNPSIHKIAETLLGSSSIELFCVGSASEALMMLDSGERFDVALLDTAMPGMDGWELLSRMRKHPDSALIPIAMMAGVLDTVDPEKLKRAPIQGFIKKPIELRELAERVQQLLATPVALAEHQGAQEEPQGEPNVFSPLATVPGTKIKNLPEFRGVVDGPSPKEIQPSDFAYFDDMKNTNDTNDQDDLLLLTPEDFWFEEASIKPGSPDFILAQATAQAMAQAEIGAPAPLMDSVDSTLDLEELDLEALKDLPHEEPATLPAVSEVSHAHGSEEPSGEPFGEIAEGVAIHAEPALAVEASVMTGELPEEETLAIPGLAVQALSAHEPIAVDFSAHEFLTEDIPAHAFSDLGEVPDFENLAPESQPAESLAAPIFKEAASHAEPNEGSVFPSAAALVQVLMSDPVLMDALAKAVVARLGDQALREIAWELMPELAEKLPR